jgi:hypothetical protein
MDPPSERRLTMQVLEDRPREAVLGSEVAHDAVGPDARASPLTSKRQSDSTRLASFRSSSSRSFLASAARASSQAEARVVDSEIRRRTSIKIGWCGEAAIVHWTN